jgi:CubicO group peptidase (beta-lactamase class C family)
MRVKIIMLALLLGTLLACSKNGGSDSGSNTGTSPSLVSITITPANPSGIAGNTQQFTATGTYSDNSTKELTSSVTWASSNTAVATMNSAGLASMVAAGAATITATSGSVSGQTTLTVTSVVSTTCTDPQIAQLEQDMTSALTATTTDADFTLMLESADGRNYSYSTGQSTSTTSYESASTSKLVTAVVILSLIDRGTTTLTLDSRPQDLISFWTPTAGNPASAITLRHLLSFASGFYTEPLCINAAIANFNTCVQNIYNTNINNNIVPGSEFYYSGTHLQIAGLMAINAGGYADWTAMFDDFKTRTGLFSHSTYDLPSSSNPRLAGGMHWIAEDYLAFLQALYSGRILSANMSAELWANQRGAATVVNSPILTAMGEDWGYGLGNWVECKTPSFNCGSSLQRNSSPGAYGAYPFIDFENRYFGILARQGAQGTFANGINLFRTVETTANKWATKSCGN